MEVSERAFKILEKVLKQHSGSVLEQSRFGRSEMTLFWIGLNYFIPAMKELSQEGGLDLLENLSAMQVEDNIVCTYFLKNSKTEELVVIRVSAAIEPGEDWVDLQSVQSIWSPAQYFEDEISRLFGVRFSGEEGVREWGGFPLRKSFFVSGGVNL